METSGDASNNWIPTSFSGTSETGDSLSSFQSAATPGALDQQSIDDLSFDAISRQKLSLTGLGTVPASPPKTTTTNNNAPPGMFEEDTRSSWSGEPPKPTTFKETALDGEEDSLNSVPSQSLNDSSAPKAEESPQQEEAMEEEQENVITFPPENLFEYMWPPESNEFFFLQEQVSDYLNVKSFKRKYPDLVRRSVELDERRFLKERGVVTEVQCDLGLTALRSEEVLELMSRDHPDRYREYIRVLREKTAKEKEKKVDDKTRAADMVKKAVQSAADYNAHLNQERREERKSCMDLQTYTVHYPNKGKPKEVRPKMGKYPVALLPGQFQDYYKQYSADELKYLPLNTVLYGPVKESVGPVTASSDSEDSSGSSCDSSSSSSEGSSECKVCHRSEGDLLRCSECGCGAHPACVAPDAQPQVLRGYAWQCTDCKVCSQCKDPDDEERMLFCDACDRGYHTFCVGLKALPQQGKWVCRKCGTCSVCGATQPDGNGAAQWQYEAEKDPARRPKIFCQACFKKKR